MSEVFHAFGVDWKLIVIQIFNFTILMAVLWHFLYTPVLKMLNERQEKVAKGVRDATKAEKTLNKAEDEKKDILAAAHKDAEAVNARAKEVADAKVKDASREAEDRAARIVKDAETRGEEILKAREKEAEAEVAKAAVLAAEKILKQS